MSALEYGTSYGGALLCDGTWSSPRKLVQSECQSCGMITHKKEGHFLKSSRHTSEQMAFALDGSLYAFADPQGR